MIKVNSNIETYRVNEEFCVDIVETDTMYESWLYSSLYGIKSLMFGTDKSDYTKQEFVEMVEKAVWNDGFIENYIEDYYDE